MNPQLFLVVSAILFAIGVIGVLTRRGAIMILMSVELMLNAANLAFITFSRMHDQPDGQIFAFFIMTLAAAEAAVGLALIISVYRNRHSVDVENLDLLKW